MNIIQEYFIPTTLLVSDGKRPTKQVREWEEGDYRYIRSKDNPDIVEKFRFVRTELSMGYFTSCGYFRDPITEPLYSEPSMPIIEP